MSSIAITTPALGRCRYGRRGNLMDTIIFAWLLLMALPALCIGWACGHRI
jgi:hypothetical protein